MSTIADVAARAGVSKATASRALSGRGYVSEETRARVTAAAQDLAYVAHPTATSLATGRTGTVAVIVPSLNRWFFAEALSGIQEALFGADYDLALYTVPEDSPTRARIFGDVLPRRRFDGVITCGVRPRGEERRSLLRTNRAVVGMGAGAEGTAAVSIDDAAAARIATEHLLELGHTSIAFIGGAAGTGLSIGDARRLDGYRAAMDAAGLGDRIRHAAGAPTTPGGYAAAVDLLGDRRTRPTAVVGVCDEAAIGAIIAARRLGLAVPTAFSVIGIDDHEHAEMFALTTISQSPREQGRQAVRMLRARLEDPDAAPEHIVAAFRLTVRNSTAFPG